MNNKKTAKILSLVAVLAMVLTMTVALGVSASAVEYSTVDPTVEIVDEVVVTTEDQLKSAIRKNSADDASITNIGPIELADGRKVTLRDGGTIILGADIETNWVFGSTIGVNKSFTIKSAEGHTYTIYRGNKANPSKTTTSKQHFQLQSGVTVIVENVVFDGQKNLITTGSASGGAFYLNAGTTLILNQGAVIQNYNGTLGGAIYSGGGTLIINDGAAIKDNDAMGSNSRGGALYFKGSSASAPAKVYMMGGEISGNENASTFAGAAYIGANSAFYMYGGVIENNALTGTNGTTGTAILLAAGGKAYLVGGKIQEHAKYAIHVNGSGNAVYLGDPKASLPTGTDTPTGEPLFVYQNTGMDIPSSVPCYVVSDLPAGSRVFLAKAPTLQGYTPASADELADSIFLQNGDSDFGGPLFYEGGALTFKNAYQVGDTTYATLAAACTAAASNGTVNVLYDTFTYGILPAGTYTIDGNGHTLYRPIEGTRMFTPAADANVTIVDLKLDGDGTTTSGNGGAFSLASGVSLTVGEGTVISNFTATSNGGAIYVDAGATVTVSGGEIKNNNAANGAGIACDGTLNLSGGTISDNTATGYGGGVLIAGKSSNGGTNGQLNMTGGTISDNTANDKTYGGGGIYFTSRGRGAITGGTISGNTATTKGGAIYFGGTSSATYTVSNVIVTGNNAATGAGIYVNSAALVTFESGEISDNHATNGGGAFVEGTLTVTGGTISENTATNNGGAISFTKALNINGGTISGNTAKNGGAISASGTLTMTSGTISGNTATGNGGGIYVASGKTATVSGGTVSKNKAATGAGIACDGTLNLSGTALIQNNAAASFGGGLSIAGSSSAGTHGTLNMSGGTVSGNTADGFSDTYGGGGIFFTSQGIGNITGGVIENNVAHHGAGIQARYLLTVKGATISGNVARTAGAGIYVVGSAKVEIGEGTAIENNIAAALNKAMYGGGAYVAAGGTLVMNGGRISGNVVSDYTASKDSRGAGVYTLGNFWMTGGEISGNTLVGTLGCGVFCGQGNFYMLGGKIRDNVLARYAHTNFPRGSALMFTSNAESAYLLGGTIEGNVIKDQVTVEQSESETVATPVVERDNGNVISITTFDGTKQYVVTLNETLFEGEGEFAREICIYAGNAKIYIGGSVAGATVPDAIVNNVNGVSVSESVVTSSNALVIPATEKGDTFGYVSGATAEQLILSGALAEGSRVVIPDNYSEEVAYAMTVADDTSIGCIFLGGADALYRPTVADGKLVWPAEAYQLYQSAALDQSISFRVAFARRNAKADILSDVTVEQITKAQNKETAAWDSKAVNAEWKQDVYNGSPCIVVSLAPKMAMDQIIVKKGDVAVKDEGYTFASYLKAMKENELYSTDTELMGLVDATLNYCAAAQNYFNYNNGTLANVGVDTIVGTIPEVTMSLNDPNKIFHSAQVDVASTVSVAIIAKGDVTATVTVGTTPITPEYQDLKDEYSEIYTAIVIPDLTAAALMQDITVEIGDASLTYSVPAYAYNMQEKSDDAELVSIVQALYAYAVAADAYAN